MCQLFCESTMHITCLFYNHFINFQIYEQTSPSSPSPGEKHEYKECSFLNNKCVVSLASRHDLLMSSSGGWYHSSLCENHSINNTKPKPELVVTSITRTLPQSMSPLEYANSIVSCMSSTKCKVVIDVPRPNWITKRCAVSCLCHVHTLTQFFIFVKQVNLFVIFLMSFLLVIHSMS